MSIHIEAKTGDIAETVLMPGDPLRAKTVAEKFLENPVCYNNLRGMLGFTGLYKGKRVSIQGSGMGMPSMSIYANELFRDYGVKSIIRFGTAGALTDKLKIKDIVLAMTASTDSAINKNIFGGGDFCPPASFDLLEKAVDNALSMGLNVLVGNVLSTDCFYSDSSVTWKKWAEFGVLAVEMETNALYSLAAKYDANALSILTISDSLVTGEAIPMIDRQNTLENMAKLALETAV